MNLFRDLTPIRGLFDDLKPAAARAADWWNKDVWGPISRGREAAYDPRVQKYGMLSSPATMEAMQQEQANMANYQATGLMGDAGYVQGPRDEEAMGIGMDVGMSGRGIVEAMGDLGRSGTRVFIPNEINPKHFAEVVREMRIKGAPTIHAVRLEDGSLYALEGSHRLAAAKKLGLEPEFRLIHPNIGQEALERRGVDDVGDFLNWKTIGEHMASNRYGFQDEPSLFFERIRTKGRAPTFEKWLEKTGGESPR